MKSVFKKLLTWGRRAVYLALWVFDQAVGRKATNPLILCYHSFKKDGWQFSLEPDDFKKQIDYLLKHFSPISVSELEAFLLKGKELSGPVFLLTFDDGYQSLMEIKDYLKFQQIKPVVFILANSQRADRKELGTDEKLIENREIETLLKEGWEIGCHSATHADFRNLSHLRLWQETIGAKKVLERKIGREIKYFAYPKGRISQEMANQILKEYQLSFSLEGGPVKPGVSRASVPRIGIDRTHSFSEFKAALSPSVLWLKKILIRVWLMADGLAFFFVQSKVGSQRIVVNVKSEGK
jgi:peptidoglycan/xylan/chitin deacetylase (PgdA/CDA1 family)